MSTYGTAVVCDVPVGTEIDLPDAVVADVQPTDGWRRTTVFADEVGEVNTLLSALIRAGAGRIAIAEDNDEYGGLSVIAGYDAAVNGIAVVYRRYVLNADPADPDEVAAAIADLGEDPRAQDRVGTDAAREAAVLFGVSPDAALAAEVDADAAWENIGVVGGPFPLWEALGLPWPETH